MPPTAYPNTATVGRLYAKYRKREPEWTRVVVESIYEDGGADRNLKASIAVQRWDFEYKLTEAQAKVLDDHYDSANGTFQGFEFTEPRDFPLDGSVGATFTDVHYESYERDHARIFGNQIRRITLVKRPS